MPGAVIAQEEDVAELSRVQVTGTRIQRTDIETATPVYVMSNEDIRAGGYQRVEDILNTLPQVEAAQTAFVSNGSSLTASVDLRGLGSARTLVLF
ncbi:MAG: TonB-dependent receptor plug domain-containing protein, partial [Proteobacteria bacterium]|nr:TonB-dependent receptor plug domain-containing protein [Pseudomonadota bacterium]